MKTTLRLEQGETVAIPGTELTITSTYVAQRIASTRGDAFPRSMVTATLVIRDGGRRVHEAHHVVGTSFCCGALQFHLTDAVNDEITVEIEGGVDGAG